MASAFPPRLATASKPAGPSLEKPTPARIATISSIAIPTPSTIATTRWPRSRSSNDSSLSTPSSMMTNRNSTMIAPA